MSARILSRVVVEDAAGLAVLRDELAAEIADPVGANGKRETVVLAAAFNALAPPTGATFVRIAWVSGTGALTLKGITGDTGIALGVLSASSPAITLPLSAAVLGILASAVGSVEVTWL